MSTYSSSCLSTEWSSKEVQTLIDITHLQTTPYNWENIAQALHRNTNIQRSPSSCRNKWNRLIEQFAISDSSDSDSDTELFTSPTIAIPAKVIISTTTTNNNNNNNKRKLVVPSSVQAEQQPQPKRIQDNIQQLVPEKPQVIHIIDKILTHQNQTIESMLTKHLDQIEICMQTFCACLPNYTRNKKQ